ncbi:MAG: hypothetical protein IT318_13440 [Anaerolineales bacterium]|nr:hypothetical protein [Anaerolineales bacterium]
MPGLALPAWARPAHPIVRYERRHWQNSRGWRLARKLLWGGSLTFVLAPAACALAFSLGARFTGPAEVVLAAGGAFTAGLVLTATLAFWLNNLSASLLAATLVARERERQTWSLLRLTGLTTLDILGGKLAAVGYTLARPLKFILALRVLALLSGLLTVALALAASGLTLSQVSEYLADALREIPFSFAELRWQLGFALAAGLVGVASWLAEPLLGAVYNAAVGLMASCLARSRGNAVVIVVAAHFCLGLGLYAPLQQGAVLALAPLVQIPAVANSPALLALTAGPQVALSIGLRLAVAIGCLLFSLRRAETLGD